MNQVEKTCAQCGKNFLCPRSHADRRTCCSQACYYVYRKGKTFVERVIACERCGKEFLTHAGAARFCSDKCREQQVEMKCEHCGNPYRIKEGTENRRKYCSTACFYAARTAKTHVDKICPICNKQFRVRAIRNRKYCSVQCSAIGTSAAKAARERGQPAISGQGYRTLWHNGKYTLEHRLLMERRLGRALLPFESVHHKNGDRADNREENLELWVTAPRYGQRQADMIPWAIKFLESAGYIVTKQEASSSFNAGAPMVV
jgi:HNH endonuclease